MGQNSTGYITESRVRKKLETLGLEVRKPLPDRGIDIIAWHPDNPSKIVKIQVKGRNPKTITSYRWFQIRVGKKQLEQTQKEGKAADVSWLMKLAKVDFLVLDAVRVDETWVFSRDQALELMVMNELQYCNRPDNIFTYDEPLKSKQKEINLDIKIHGKPLTKTFSNCCNNFAPIVNFLKIQ
ncbi:MAG: hypothetical protein KAH38_12415 [Candidatus Hydrogenedentes bacterium]|nr:hypothetical protein [Candidatus Hydrogenedentota bacterium]